jgi:two-component system, NtrC family, nitrogen regulation response regulator GlnG
VTVNMGAITPSLAAAELFGAERGAYTGAVLRQAGYFEKAEGGTLFLDEIGEALPDVQVMLLRALETGEIQSVGARAPRTVSVRMVTATDANLEARIAEGAFREPLLHRMAGYEIILPPLRDRRDDIGRLLIHFAREELERLGDARRLESPGPEGKPWLPASLVARLARHDWPGNVRQLRNLVQQLVVGSQGAPRLGEGPTLERLLRQPLPVRQERVKGALASTAEPRSADGIDAHGPSRSSRQSGGSGWRRPSDVSEGELLAALRRSRWDLKAAALGLRVSRTSLYAMVESCPRVRRAGDLAPEEIADCFRLCGGDVERMVDRLEVSKRALLRRIRELRLG